MDKTGKRSKKIISQAQRKYNWLLNVPMVVNPQEGRGFAEVWQPGDEGAPGSEVQRNPNIPIDQSGIEVYNDEGITEDMLAGEAVSHILNDPRNANHDPKIVEHYEKFKSSLTPKQHERLLRRFYRSQEKYNERRSFDDWKEYTGLPGEFRAYPFKQWDKENKGDYSKDFTPEQVKDLDIMMDYLTTIKK